MTNNQQSTDDGAGAEAELTLKDLLESESEVLRRLGNISSGSPQMAGHNSSTSGHNSMGSHSSHTSSQIERPLEG